MPFRHPRNIINDPKKFDQLEEQKEVLTIKLLRGEISQDEYIRQLDKMTDYIDLRRLVAEVQPVLAKSTNSKT
jgi:hypothetical protein